MCATALEQCPPGCLIEKPLLKSRCTRTGTMGNVAHLLNLRTRECTTMVEGHQQMGRIAHRTAFAWRYSPVTPNTTNSPTASTCV